MPIVGGCCCGGGTGCPTCVDCPNGSPRQWRFTIADVRDGVCPCSRMNGTWTVTWIGGCTWRYADANIIFTLDFKVSGWEMVITFVGTGCEVTWATFGDPFFCCRDSILKRITTSEACGPTGLAPFTIHPVDLDCCRFPPCCGCESYPDRWQTTVAGVIDGVCDPPHCLVLNRTWTFVKQPEVCQWQADFLYQLCYGGAERATLTCIGVNDWSLNFNFETGSVAVYRFQPSDGNWNCLGMNVMRKTEEDIVVCRNFPATITLIPA